MTIPISFKDIISKKFYDKTISVYSQVESTNNEGWSRIKVSTVLYTFKGNVNYTNLDKIQMSYGIKEDVSAVITTASYVAGNSIILFDNILHKVIQSIPQDSHYTIITQKWIQKSLM